MNSRTATRPHRPFGHRLTPLALVALLTACASISAPTPSVLPEQVPAHWASVVNQPPGEATDLSAWWQRFNDPTLSGLIEQALRANPSVKGAQAALRQARAQAAIQQANLGPSLGASASAQRSRSGNDDASNRFQAGFDASWEPDIFGGNRSAAEASEADVQASAASLADTQVSLAAEVAVGYVNLRALQARTTITQNNLDTQLETLQITQWRTQAGLASSLDAEQLASLEQTRAQLPALQAGVNQAAPWAGGAHRPGPGRAQHHPVKPGGHPSLPDLALAFPADTLRQRLDVRGSGTARRCRHRESERCQRRALPQLPAQRLPGPVGPHPGAPSPTAPLCCNRCWPACRRRCLTAAP
ncbi:MAG: TolC family protein [Burkholderiaceae bacterium]